MSLRLTGLSPLDVCTPNTKSSTATTVVNPVESIINTVAGLKSFDLSTSFAPLGTLSPGGPNGAPPPPPDPAIALFGSISQEVPRLANAIYAKQLHWQGLYQADLDFFAVYLSRDYRGANSANFRPDTDPDPQLMAMRNHATLPIQVDPQSPDSPPTELDYAPLQALVDEMSSLQGRMIDSCTKPGASLCDPSVLQTAAQQVDKAKALLSVAQDNLKTLQTAQTSVASDVATLHKGFVDFQNRLALNVVAMNGGILEQRILLGPDYGATDAGTVACTNDVIPTQATTDTINFSVLYQNVPAFTVSTGLLVTFLKKTDIGTSPESTGTGTSGTYFAVTDAANAQVFPMAFVNYRLWPPVLKNWWGQPENELVITNSASAGIGVNPNTGTNQPEFFVGDAIGFSRVYLHLGAHFGRTETLGGGFTLNTPVPTGFSGAAPINWSYHPAFSIGLSVRIAPF